MSGTIEIGEVVGGVARMVVRREAKLNVLDGAMMQAMIEGMARLAGEAGLRVLVLEGAGTRAMIGGADILEMAGLDGGSARGFITRLHQVCAAIRGFPVPVIARMRGFTLGAGLEIAASCDLRVAAEDARMGMPEVRIGIPSVIEAALLPGLIGWGRTRRLLLTGEVIDAATALDWGLVEYVVPVAELDARVALVAAQIVAGAPHAMRLQKRLIAEWEERSPEAGILRGVECFARAWDSDEPGRLMAGFLASRR